jgi:hypothetical protein
MMNDQEIDAGRDRLLKRDDASVNGRANFSNAPAVGQLQTIERTRSVLEGVAAGSRVALKDDVVEGC